MIGMTHSLQVMCGISGYSCSKCTEGCEYRKDGITNSRYAAEHNRISEVKNLASFYEEMMTEESACGMTEADLEGPAVKRCAGSEKDAASSASRESERMDHAGMRGSVLEEALETINGARLNVYGGPENSFAFIGMFWQIVDMAAPEMSVEVLAAVKMALMKIARILSKPNDRDSWRDAAGYLGLGCDMVCAQDIDKEGVEVTA